MTSPPYLMQISSQIHYGARQMSRSRAKPGPLTLTAHLFYHRFSLTLWEAHYLQVLSLRQTHTPLSPSKTEIRHLTLLQSHWHWMLGMGKFKSAFLEDKKECSVEMQIPSLHLRWSDVVGMWDHIRAPLALSSGTWIKVFCCKLTWYPNCGTHTARTTTRAFIIFQWLK